MWVRRVRMGLPLTVMPAYQEEPLGLLSLVISKYEMPRITVNIYEAEWLFGSSNCIFARSKCSMRRTSLSARIIGGGHMLQHFWTEVSDWGKYGGNCLSQVEERGSDVGGTGEVTVWFSGKKVGAETAPSSEFIARNPIWQTNGLRFKTRRKLEYYGSVASLWRRQDREIPRGKD